MLARVALQQVLPFLAELRAAPADALIEVLADPVRNEELCVLGPAVGALGLADLLLAERLAVNLRRVDLVRRAPADVAVQDDQGRSRHPPGSGSSRSWRIVRRRHPCR